MLAPDFECFTVEGDTIQSTTLDEKPIILANSCRCGGDILSAESFYEIRDAFSDKIYALRLDGGIKSGLEEWNINTLDTYNKEIYDNYRKHIVQELPFSSELTEGSCRNLISKIRKVFFKIPFSIEAD